MLAGNKVSYRKGRGESDDDGIANILSLIRENDKYSSHLSTEGGGFVV